MLEIKWKEVDIEQEELITDLEAMLGCPAYKYDKNNAESQADHRVELPFKVMSTVVQQLADAKNVIYQNSYSKRGLFSIFFNMERKWERMVSQVFNGKNVMDYASETFLDSCIDLAAYSTKLCAWMCSRRPDLYLKLLQSVRKEMETNGVPMEFKPRYRPAKGATGQPGAQSETVTKPRSPRWPDPIPAADPDPRSSEMDTSL